MPGFFTRVRPEWSLLPELMSRVALCYTRAPNGITVSASRTLERQYHQRLPLSSSPYPAVGVIGGVVGVGTTVGLPGVVVGVPLAPGTEFISIVIWAASGNMLPLEITIATLLNPGCVKR